MKIPRRHYVRYDGCCKLITKDCGDKCEWYRLTGDIKICGWGKAFKYLVATKNPRKCEVRNRKQDDEPSIKYVNKYLSSQALVTLDWFF